MLRRLIKTGVAATLHGFGLDKRLASRSGANRMPVVLGYHRVVPDMQRSTRYAMEPMLTSLRTFERHLDWFGRDYEFVSLDDIDDWLSGRRQFSRPAVAVTFDDGYNDFYHHAAPVLYRKGIPATVFVVTDLIGTRDLLLHDELYLLLSNACASWPDAPQRLTQLLLDLELPLPVVDRARAVLHEPMQTVWLLLETLAHAAISKIIATLRTETEVDADALAEMLAMDWNMLREVVHKDITVGSHSRSHACLSNETWEHMVEETEGSRCSLEQQLGTSVVHFSYPGGRYNSSVVHAVARAGYHCAYTSCQHRDMRYPALTIPRRLLWENSCLDAFGHFSPAMMSCQVSGVFDAFTPCRQAHS